MLCYASRGKTILVKEALNYLHSWNFYVRKAGCILELFYLAWGCNGFLKFCSAACRSQTKTKSKFQRKQTGYVVQYCALEWKDTGSNSPEWLKKIVFELKWVNCWQMCVKKYEFKELWRTFFESKLHKLSGNLRLFSATNDLKLSALTKTT